MFIKTTALPLLPLNLQSCTLGPCPTLQKEKNECITKGKDKMNGRESNLQLPGTFVLISYYIKFSFPLLIQHLCNHRL